VRFRDAWGVWCTISNIAFVWPQVWRTVRHDTTHGISPFAPLHGMVGAALWFTYGLQEAIPAMWVANASFLTAQSIMGAVMLRQGRMDRLFVLRFVTALVILLSVGLPVSPAVVGWMATVVSASSMVPTVVHVAREKNLHGISVLSWGITIASAASWMAYGFMLDDPIMVNINYVTIPMMFFVITRAVRWRLANGVPVLRAAA